MNRQELVHVHLSLLDLSQYLREVPDDVQEIYFELLEKIDNLIPEDNRNEACLYL